MGDDLPPRRLTFAEVVALPKRGSLLTSKPLHATDHHQHQRHSSSFSSFFKKIWEQCRCFRCFAKGHLLANCREPLRCFKYRRIGHRGVQCTSTSRSYPPPPSPPTEPTTVQVAPPSIHSSPPHDSVHPSPTHLTSKHQTSRPNPSPPLPTPGRSQPTTLQSFIPTVQGSIPTVPPICHSCSEVHMFIHPSDVGTGNHLALLKAGLVEVSSGAVTEQDVLNLLRTELGENYKFSVRRHT